MNERIKIESDPLYVLHTLTQLGCMSEREEVGIRERDYCCREIILLFLGFNFGVDSISKEFAGFSPLWFPRGKYLCLLSLVFDCCSCYSLS